MLREMRINLFPISLQDSVTKNTTVYRIYYDCILAMRTLYNHNINI